MSRSNRAGSTAGSSSLERSGSTSNMAFHQSSPRYSCGSPNATRAGALSPMLRDALVDVDWSFTPPLPPPTPYDVRESPFTALSTIVPGLFLTGQRTADLRDRMQLHGCRLVLKLNGDIDDAPFQVYEWDNDSGSQRHHHVDEATFLSRFAEEVAVVDPDRALAAEPMFVRVITAEDSPQYDIAAHFEELSHLIEVVLASRRRLSESSVVQAWIAGGHDVRLPAVVVHCMAGISRSGAVVLAYLMKRYRLNQRKALEYVKISRPIVAPNVGFSAQLALWGSTCGRLVTDDDTAREAAAIVLQDNATMESLFELLSEQLRVLGTSNRMHGDRAMYGRFFKHLIGETLPIRAAADILRQAFRASTVEEVPAAFMDNADFFSNWMEITGSIKCFVPNVLLPPPRPQHEADANGQPSDEGSRTAWWVPEDAMDGELFKMLCMSRAVTECSERTEVLCRFLRGLTHSQLRGAVADPWSVPVVDVARPVFFELDAGCSGPSLPISSAWRVPVGVPMATTFPFLRALCVSAEGFVSWSDRDRCASEYFSSHHNPAQRLEVARKVYRKLRRLMVQWFLVIRGDGATGACAMRHLTRWAPCGTGSTPHESYLGDLKGDIEVVVFETLEAAFFGPQPTAAGSSPGVPAAGSASQADRHIPRPDNSTAEVGSRATSPPPRRAMSELRTPCEDMVPSLQVVSPPASPMTASYGPGGIPLLSPIVGVNGSSSYSIPPPLASFAEASPHSELDEVPSATFRVRTNSEGPALRRQPRAGGAAVKAVSPLTMEALGRSPSASLTSSPSATQSSSFLQTLCAPFASIVDAYVSNDAKREALWSQVLEPLWTRTQTSVIVSLHEQTNSGIEASTNGTADDPGRKACADILLHHLMVKFIAGVDAFVEFIHAGLDASARATLLQNASRGSSRGPSPMSSSASFCELPSIGGSTSGVMDSPPYHIPIHHSTTVDGVRGDEGEQIDSLLDPESATDRCLLWLRRDRTALREDIRERIMSIRNAVHDEL